MDLQSSDFIRKTKQEINCKVVRTMLNYAREKRGEDCERRLIGTMGLDPDYLRNENNWVSFEIYNRGCEFLKEEFGDYKIMYKVGIYSFSNIENFGAIAKMAIYLISPDSIFKRTAEVANQAVKFGLYRVVEIGENRLLLEFKNNPGFPFYQHSCDYRLGTFAGVPQIFGLPVAKHRSIQCMGQGHDRCLYEFEWQARTWGLFGRKAQIGLALGLTISLGIGALNTFSFAHFSQPLFLAAVTAIIYLISVILDMKHAAQYNALIYSGKSDEIEEAIVFANQKYQEAAETVTRLQAIIEANGILQSKLIKTELIDIVLEIIKHNLRYDRAMILFHDPSTNTLTHAKIIGRFSSELARRASTYAVPLDDAIALDAKVFSSGEALLVADINQVESYDKRTAVAISDSKSFVILPFMVGNKVAGTITVDNVTSARPMGQDDVKILSTLLNILGIALENAELYENLEIRVRERTAQLSESTAKLESAYQELQQAQSQLLHSEKMASLGKLVAGIAHEMNNPAGIVSGHTELIELHVLRLKKDLDSLEAFVGAHPEIEQTVHHVRKNINEIDESIDPSKRAIGRIKAIVQDLRNFSRLDDNEIIPADLNEGFENTIKFFHNRTDGRITIDTRFNKLPVVYCYPGHINQAFSNIFSNAIEAIEGDGEIVITTSSEYGNPTFPEPHVLISVSDSGVGIPKEQIDKIFDPFFTTKEIGSGKGLGLSIAYGIVKQHHGHIVAESTVGKGTVIRFMIPVNSNPQQKGLYHAE